MKKGKIALISVLAIAIIGGALYFVRINKIQKEQKAILTHLTDCTSAIKGQDLQSATQSYENALSIYEQSNHKNTLQEVKKQLDEIKVILNQTNNEAVNNAK